MDKKTEQILELAASNYVDELRWCDLLQRNGGVAPLGVCPSVYEDVWHECVVRDKAYRDVLAILLDTDRDGVSEIMEPLIRAKFR